MQRVSGVWVALSGGSGGSSGGGSGGSKKVVALSPASAMSVLEFLEVEQHSDLEPGWVNEFNHRANPECE